MEKHIKQEEILKIIGLLRERELLWNMNCFSYRRNDLKKKALEEIANECNMTEDCVKKKLKSLRSTYVMEKRKVENSKRSGCDAANVYQPSLFWFEEMAFLDSSISTRKSKDNVQKNILDESFEQEDVATSKSHSCDISHTPSTSWAKRRREDADTDKFDEALAQIVSLSKPQNDVFSAFAESMATQLRTIPEEVAYKTMADMQAMIFQRKFSNVNAAKAEEVRTSSPDTCDSDILYAAMSDAEILGNEEDSLLI